METQSTESRDTYQIKISGFEGPFGLLLELVEKRKLFINDVSLASVTEDYLNYMSKLGDNGLIGNDEISSFIIVASTLILIKSKSLLPNLSLTSEEEGDIKNLEERLRLYELFTKFAGNIKKDFGKKIIFAPLERKHNNVLVFLPDSQITKNSMMTFAQGVLGGMPKKVILPEAQVKKVISIEEMIEKLTDRIKNAVQMSFKDLHPSIGSGRVATKEEKITAIVGFLAMLELVRQGIIDAVQEFDKGDIIMNKQEAVTENI
jgi:segregation and condensation protein A